MAKTKKAKPIKRPYATLYYTDDKAREPSVSSQGAASTERGAIRATVVRIFMGEFKKAVIYDRIAGIPIYTVKVGANGLQVHYGVATETQANLRRVK